MLGKKGISIVQLVIGLAVLLLIIICIIVALKSRSDAGLGAIFGSSGGLS